jgi:hypothetical protein
MVFQLSPVRKNERKILPLPRLTPGGSFSGQDKKGLYREGAVPYKPSETGNNMPFQRHRCPGPEFQPEKDKKGTFSRNFPIEMVSFPLLEIFKTPLTVKRNSL